MQDNTKAAVSNPVHYTFSSEKDAFGVMSGKVEARDFFRRLADSDETAIRGAIHSVIQAQLHRSSNPYRGKLVGGKATPEEIWKFLTCSGAAEKPSKKDEEEAARIVATLAKPEIVELGKKYLAEGRDYFTPPTAKYGKITVKIADAKKVSHIAQLVCEARVAHVSKEKAAKNADIAEF
jgi:hypothetical protein